MGLDRYKSAFDVYADKLGLKPEEPDNEAMRQGRDLEVYVAELFNWGLTWSEIEKETGIPIGSLTYYRKQAKKYGLLDHKARQENQTKRQEEKEMGRVIKAGAVLMVDGSVAATAVEQKTDSVPELEEKQEAVSEPQPKPEAKGFDLDSVMAAFESTVRTAEKVLDLAQRCRKAAATCVEHLGEDRCQTAITGIYQMFYNELEVIK